MRHILLWAKNQKCLQNTDYSRCTRTRNANASKYGNFRCKSTHNVLYYFISFLAVTLLLAVRYTFHLSILFSQFIHSRIMIHLKLGVFLCIYANKMNTKYETASFSHSLPTHSTYVMCVSVFCMRE